MLTDERKQEVIALCGRLVKAKSYSGEERQVAKELELFFKSSGFDEVLYDEYGCIIGCIHGNKSGPRILLDGHIDTVPVTDEEKWTYPPFGAELHEGRMYGRGTSDMKGAVAAMACALKNYAQDTKRDFGGSLYLAGVVHEECFEGVAARSVSGMIKPDYVIIGEASDLNLKIGQRGRGEVKLETFGMAAHSANPEKGVNAVYGMLRAVDEIKKLPLSVHPVLGKGILELTDIKSSPYPGASVVPSYCAATYDRRLLVGETREDVLAPIQALLGRMKEENKEFEAAVSFSRGEEFCYTGTKIEGERFFPGWLYEEKASFVQAVLKELRANGFKPAVTQYNFCTNGSHYAGEANIKTIGLGPSREDLAHTRDEYIEIGELTAAVECYMCAVRALLAL